jgi:hypothetical protein
MEIRPPIAGQAAHQRRSAADCSEFCEVVGVAAKAVVSRSGRSPHWVKVKNPNAPAVTREAEEDWGR